MSGNRRLLYMLAPFKSIRNSMIFWFSLLIVMTVVIFSVISIAYTEDTVVANSIDYTSRLIRQVNRDIDSYIDYMDNISSMVVNGGDVQKYLFETQESYEKAELYSRIVTQFNTVVEARSDISNIAVVTPDRRSIINDGTDKLNKNVALPSVDWYMEALNGEESILTASHVQHVIRNDYKWVVTLGKGIRNPETGKNEAVFFIDLNYKLLKDLCENNSLADNSYVFIVDENGKIIYHPKQQLLYSGLTREKIDEVLQCEDNYFITDEKSKSKLYTVSVSEKTGWRVVGVAYLEEMMKHKQETQELYLITCIVLLLAATTIATLLAGAITKPIKDLKNSIKKVEKGHFEEANISDIADNEIGSVSNSFNRMTVKIKELMEQNTYEQEQKRKSEMKALRSQIKPHFLYNTLDSIIWMAEGGKNKEVVLMTSALARLLRQSISNDNERITMEKEVEYARSYLTIQKMRYKDKLEYEIDIEPEIKREPVINLILQPLVENAIYHGIKYKGTKGMVTIRAYSEENEVVIQVTDDGIGMDKETLDGIFTKSKASEGKNGVGVYNVHERLRLYYGEDCGLCFESQPGKGTTVTIRIPRVLEGQENESI